MTSKAQVTGKIAILHYIKIKSLSPSKGTINRLKGNPQHGKKKKTNTYINHVSNKGLISRLCKDNLQFDKKNLIKNGKGLE